ncbi:ABC transporter permease [Rhizobium sp. KVB221]|uniref:Autoinducer 2 import system permease protein LsrD n=1 Tax=Rhizobium setariae TaxID=2801340 RepID=A0A937CN15_9HYPH|nr:ABC transporter permease [Rhizobium setariae]MBL0371544.1 ABC transporter permease [Rhizobium setariae]
MNNITGAIFRTQWSGILAGVIAGAIALSFATPSFLTEFNWFVMLRSICVSLLVAFSQMVMLGVGQMNLSVGALGGLVAVIVGGLMDAWGVPVLPAIFTAMVAGGLAGYLNGWLTVRTGINGFIVTLATASGFAGINLGLTKAIPFYNLPEAFVAFGNGRLGLFPYLLIIPLIVTVALVVFFSRIKQGRYLLAVGGNSHAAQLSGISVPRAIITAHVISGLLAAAAGILAVAQLGSAQPTIGSDWLVISFAAPIIGGASLAGGSVSIIGTVIAVALIGLIQNAMVLLAVDPYWVTFLLGALILAAVWINRYRAIRVGED